MAPRPLNQAFVLVRGHDHPARPPWNLSVDEAMVDHRANLLARWVPDGRDGMAGAPPADRRPGAGRA